MSLDFYIKAVVPTDVYDGNMTHNVVPMWDMAGIYDELYNSEGKLAKDILPKLKYGREKMANNPEEFKKLNPKNGWGTYEGALLFLDEIITACETWPQGIIHISK